MCDAPWNVDRSTEVIQFIHLDLHGYKHRCDAISTPWNMNTSTYVIHLETWIQAHVHLDKLNNLHPYVKLTVLVTASCLCDLLTVSVWNKNQQIFYRGKNSNPWLLNDLKSIERIVRWYFRPILYYACQELIRTIGCMNIFLSVDIQILARGPI